MYWEDYYLKHPVDARRTKGGHVVYTTGDPLIDKWERELEAGLEPDLTEGLSMMEREKEKRALERLKRRQRQDQIAESHGLKDEGFSDSYSRDSDPVVDPRELDRQMTETLTEAGVALLGAGVDRKNA